MLTVTEAEIVELTGKTQHAAQLRHLRRMGIRAERRADGSILVVRDWLQSRPKKAVDPSPRLKSDREQAQEAR